VIPGGEFQMMRSVAGFAWSAILVTVFSAAMASADVDPEPVRGGGGEIPTPFSSNQKVELADGEIYSLVGTVKLYGGEAYFEIDFAQHPWLASAKRQSSPYYALSNPIDYWRKFEGAKLRLSVEAQGEIVLGQEAGPRYSIRLQLLAEPVPCTDERNGARRSKR
jgi:hypothetical protein